MDALVNVVAAVCIRARTRAVLILVYVLGVLALIRVGILVLVYIGVRAVLRNSRFLLDVRQR
jgi:hypothetical protein